MTLLIVIGFCLLILICVLLFSAINHLHTLMNGLTTAFRALRIIELKLENVESCLRPNQNK
jgi:hypothetical protein